MRIAIIDDQKTDREHLSKMVKNSLTDSGFSSCHIEEYENGQNFLTHFEKDKYDLVFLDIYMDGINGIETAVQIRKTDTHVRVIFISVSNDFASESYAVHADYYLLKPYRQADLMRVIERLQLRSPEQTETVTLPNGQEISTQSIIYTSFSGHYVTIHQTGDHLFKLRCTQKEFEEKLLLCDDFVLCTKGMTVNLNKVSRLEANRFIMNNGDYVPVSRRKYPLVKQIYSDFLIKKVRGGER